MNGKQKRLNEVYQYLRDHKGIHTQKDFAKAVHYGRTSMSAAMNGKSAYLTDSLFKHICEAYPNVFDIQYLLTGKGELTLSNTNINKDEKSPDQRKSEKDIIDLASSLIVELEHLRRQTKEELMQLAQARQSLEATASELHKIIISYHHTYTIPIAAEEIQELHKNQMESKTPPQTPKRTPWNPKK